MRITGFFIICFMLAASHLQAQSSKKSKASTWQEALVELRANIEAGKIVGKAPIYSDFIRHKMPAQKMIFDVKGVEDLIITTHGGADGNGWDHAVFADPRLTGLDGKVIYLHDLKPTFAKAPHGSPKFDVNFSGKKLAIGGKEYAKGILLHANGTMTYKLGKKYAKFEVEVGIDDKSSSGSTIFKIQDARFNEQKMLEALTIEQQKGVMDFAKLTKTPLDLLLSKSDGSIEKSAIESIMLSYNDKTFFQQKMAEYDKLPSSKKVLNYIDLAILATKMKQLNEQMVWVNPEAMALYLEDMKSNKKFDYPKYKALYDKLVSQLDKTKSELLKGNVEYVAKGEAVLRLRDEIILANPLLDSDKIVVARFKMGGAARSSMAPSLGTQSNNWSNQESARRNGFNADIVELTNLNNGIKVRSVYKPENGSPIADLKMHWDGKRVMFTGTQDDKRWNIYEAKLDGSDCSPLLDIPEEDLEFYDGTYLPDGRVIATSNIGYQGVPCVNGSDPVGNMMLCDPKAKTYRRLTFDQDANWNPTITHDGKVMYTRWEYTDLTHYYSRIVMTMNPDGTEQKALYGSGSMFPNSTFDMQVLPGHSSAFVGIISGHHGVARSGRLIVFDPSKSRKGAAGMLQEIPYRDRVIEEIIKDQLVNGVWPQFIKPSPINDKYFLVAAKLNQESLWGVYLVDVFDNVTCLYEMEGEGFISPILVRSTPKPPPIPDKVQLSEKEATVFIQDIYEGEGLLGVKRGAVKELRVFAYEYAYVKTRSDHNWHGIQSGWDIKRLLGTVPVEEDGSVIFKIPANTPIAIQPVGKDGAAIQWMRSWLTGMPGEVVSCIGCHEDLNQVAIPKRVAASQMQPRKIQAPEGGVRSFTFDLEIQPILDRACVSCHNGGEAFDLKDNSKDKFGYGKSYLNFHPYIHRQGGEGDMAVLNPYEYHPNTSEMVRMLKKGHHGVELTEKEWHTLYNWIDFNAPDKGYFDANKITSIPYQGHDQIVRRKDLTDKYANGMGVDWKKEIADYAKYLADKGEIKAERPKPQKPVKEKELKVKGWPFKSADVKEMVGENATKVVDLGNGVKMKFVRIPEGQFVMGSYGGEVDAYPTSKVKIDKAFWMGEIEVTNQQFNILFPKHFSKYMDEQWKDHVDQGYPAHLPEQPVIRVSWENAMKFCKELSTRTGLKITLPTEAQWEWACRAGTDTDFWYGTTNTDFGKKENLADVTTNLFAVSGVNPQPMSKNNGMYKHYTFLPKEETVNDGSLIQVEGAHYDANPFGLYDMHGNVAEWTKSDYLPYPYSEKSKKVAEYKVVRGGSAFDRPKISTSHSRKGYYPFQPVYNVGFRVIIEE